ncbi:hypothetical protein B566_EDAN009759 [Ephemera danica]|nr:hypothetical protein B566_EDAN009759 [Ephemera danica]
MESLPSEVTDISLDKLPTSNTKTANNAAGVAILKPEYILSSAELRTVKLEDREESNTDEPSTKKAKTECTSSGRKRQRGQNKARGVPWQGDPSASLCLAMADVLEDKPWPEQCGRENCKFKHDVAAFLALKEPDLGPECPLFSAYGHCAWGACCRFGSTHITDDGHNKVNRSKFQADRAPTSINMLDRDVQQKLRKFRYDFSIAESVLAEKRKEKETHAVDEKGVEVSEEKLSIEKEIGPVSDGIKLRSAEKKTLCGSNPMSMARCAQLVQENCSVDFVDINMGCPIDLVYQQGGGSGLMRRRPTLELMVRTMSQILEFPLTVKMRTGISSQKNTAHTLMPSLHEWNVSMVTLHGRSREQRYTRTADWNYIDECARLAGPVPLFGNGDILSFEDYNLRRANTSVAGVMIGRGALIKPWIFTEIKEQRHWDISSQERLDLLRTFVNNGLEHWGSDTKGVETTRRFLLEWLSFLHRYIPVGLLEHPPQNINERPPAYKGRDELETLMASANCADWVTISEMLLGKVPTGFKFVPKHKANAWQ